MTVLDSKHNTVKMEAGDLKDAEISALRQQVLQLQAAKEQQEREFGEGRAKLKQLYMQKEEEVRVLGVELEESNSRVVIAECTAENRVEAEQRKCQEELATLHQLAREEVESAVAEVQERYEADLRQLKKHTAKLDADKKKLRHLYQQAKEQVEQLQQQQQQPSHPAPTPSILSPGVLSGLTKSIIAKHVPGLNTSSPQPDTPTTALSSSSAASSTSSAGSSAATSTSSATSSVATSSTATTSSSGCVAVAQLVPVELSSPQVAEPVMAGMDNPAFSELTDEGLTPALMTDLVVEEAVAKASVDESNVLRALLLPLQEEVRVLREQLRQRKEGEDTDSVAYSGAGEESSLAAEKSSRADLELYTSLLNAQKLALAEQLASTRQDAERCRKLLEESQRGQCELRATWQRANDQFLRSQQHGIALTARLRRLLTPDQLQRLAEEEQRDEALDEDDAVGHSSDDDPQDDAKQTPADGGKGAMASPRALKGVARQGVASPGGLEEEEEEGNIMEEVVFPERGSGSARSGQSTCSTPLTPSPSHQPLTTTQSEADSSAEAGLSTRFSPEKMPRLSEDQRRALLGSSGDKEDSEDEVLSPIAPLPGGQRVVSAAAWRGLQRNLRQTRAALAKPCQRCQHLSPKVQSLQSEVDAATAAKEVLEKAVERQRVELDREAQFRADTEEKWLSQVEEYQQKEAEWSQRLEGASRLHQDLLSRWRGVVADLHRRLGALTADREAVQLHLDKVQRENNRLAGKHLRTARQLQDETIDLPPSIEELQLLLLRLKEEVITAKVSKESTEENLSSTVALLQTQLMEEQAGRRRLEQGLRRENRELRDMVGSLQQSAGQELQSEEAQQQQLQQDQQALQALKRELNEMLKAKRQLESEVAEQKGRVSSLQHDLDLSEQTQRDFVRLSQSLQVQLEKIRQSDSEVRWQHEDDVDECNNCKQRFSSLRRKHHCRHCGRVFCSECVNKTVPGGPSARPCRVCDVCHTLLVPHATPYFSATHDGGGTGASSATK